MLINFICTRTERLLLYEVILLIAYLSQIFDIRRQFFVMTKLKFT
jgi:hypothetical protein